jgi:hypothetical protein
VESPGSRLGALTWEDLDNYNIIYIYVYICAEVHIHQYIHLQKMDIYNTCTYIYYIHAFIVIMVVFFVIMCCF